MLNDAVNFQFQNDARIQSVYDPMEVTLLRSLFVGALTVCVSSVPCVREFICRLVEVMLETISLFSKWRIFRPYIYVMIGAMDTVETA